MATETATSPAGGEAPATGEVSDSPLGLPTVLAASFAVGGFGFVLNVAVVVSGLTRSVEWWLFILGFAVVLPLSVLIGVRCADRLCGRLGAEAAAGFAAVVAGVLALAILATRLIASGLDLGATALGALTMGLWAIAATAGVARPDLLPGSLLADRRSLLQLLAALCSAAAVLAFATPSSVAVIPALGFAALAAALVAISRRRRVELPRLALRGIDLAVVVLIGLACVDVVAYATGDQVTFFNNLQVHQDFLLGPANDVLGGRGVLVETASQYGVGSIYALAGWFLVAPIGYGTLSLLNGLLLGAAWAGVYVLLRLSGCARTLAGVVVAVAVAATVYGAYAVPATWPQIGQLRFGLPLVVILAEVLALRYPRGAPWARGASFLVLGVSAIWSVETFVYTAATLVAVLAWEAVSSTADRSLRVRRFAISIGVGALACILAHALLAAGTLALTGELPDWSIYLAYVRTYTTGDVSELFPFLFGPWSLNLVVGAGYLISAIALLVVLLRGPRVLRESPATMLAIAGATAYGVATFTYVVGRTQALVYDALPAFLLAGLWLGLAMRSSGVPWSLARRIALGFAIFAGALLIGGAWPAIDDGLRRSALGHAAPGGDGLRDAVTRLWNSPPIDLRSVEGERLLDEAMPGEEPALVLTEPHLGTEILMRADRINLLPIGHPVEGDLIEEKWAPVVRRTIDGLPSGTTMLTQQAFLDATPPVDPFAAPTRFATRPVPLQEFALALIEERFDLQTVVRGSDDLVVVRLTSPAEPGSG